MEVKYADIPVVCNVLTKVPVIELKNEEVPVTEGEEITEEAEIVVPVMEVKKPDVPV